MMAVHKLAVLILLISFTNQILCEEDEINFKKMEERNRIVGGNPVNITQHPYQVLLTIRSRSVCGGALIKLDLVLTAAHCVWVEYQSGKFELAKPHEVRVIAGLSDYTTNPPANNTRDVIKVIPHNSYSTKGDKFDYDIALLKLRSMFNETMFIRLIPMRTTSTKNNENCVVTGWGVQAENSSTVSPNLRAVTVPIRDHSACKSYYKTLKVDITKNMICAGDNQKDACQGDSGGPLSCNSQLAGVVSFGNGCGRPQAAGVYMEVAKFEKWIKKNSAVRITSTLCTIFVFLPILKYFFSV